MRVECFGPASILGLVLAVSIPAGMVAQVETEEAQLQLDVDQQKKKQVRVIPPEPPSVVTAETTRLVFDVAPVSTQGLMSKQVENSLKILLKKNKRARIVHLRAFVAGSGDTRRVQMVVSEVFSDKRVPLPSLSVIQVGTLPAEGAQVLLESVAEARKPQNPHGLAFISGQAVAASEPTLETAPLVNQSLQRVGALARELGLTERDLLKVTCYCSSIRDAADIRKAITSAFPAAKSNFMQLRREYTPGHVTCEAVARLREPAGEPLKLVDASSDFSQVAVIGAERLAFTGAQLAFRYQDSDIRLAFERLGKSLEEGGMSFSDVAVSRFYTLAGAVSEKVRNLRFDFFNRDHPPANTMVELEGLPSLDASFAMDVVAIAKH